MTCKTCGSEIPEGQLACSCFMDRALTEIETKVLNAFHEGRLPLYRLVHPPAHPAFMPGVRGG